VFAERASPFKDSSDDFYFSEEFEVVGMTARASKVLGWRKTGSRREHRFGVFRKVMVANGTNVVPMVTYDGSHETEDALTRTSLGTAFGAILLKGAQMSQ
jgi:hypothetical protein